MNNKDTILVVDDSRFQHAVIRESFKDEFNFVEASSGEECMDIINKNIHIDLVLLDLVMTGIDGFEVLRRRQNMQSFLDIPVIVLTTSDSVKMQAAAYKLGANDYIIKPINKDIALSRIRNLLQSRKRIKSLISQYDEYKIKAEIDGMTGLFNKDTTIGLITEKLMEQPDKHHALLVVDIDNFKAVNDIYGHIVGDHTIGIVANVISNTFTENYIAGRIGGDEFVILASDISSKEYVYQKAEQIVNIVANDNNLSIPDNVTISIGLAFSDEDTIEYNELFSKADEALYASKQSGKSCYYEYGVVSNNHIVSKVIPVVTKLRNIVSTIEFVHDSVIKVCQAQSINELLEIINKYTVDIPCIYVDISDTTDNGKDLFYNLNKENIVNIPVIVICKEGNIDSIRNVVKYSYVKDIIYSPIDPQLLKRRITAYVKNN